MKTSKEVGEIVDKHLDLESVLKSGKKKDKEINVRMVTFARSLGRGHSALQKFAMHSNCPPPMTRKNYRKILMKIHRAAHEVAEESMANAAIEVKKKMQGRDLDTDTDLAFSTWV
ncbi:forkhead box protein K1 [Elysia marginata]|uniref:Forkhead box protein K1 n=1 Tax=Elysia marginata TaxID=1093978 RepID=A0AAV4HT90_9GAST|nr:forkhead box protein K1 [Elysia marginata]